MPARRISVRTAVAAILLAAVFAACGVRSEPQPPSSMPQASAEPTGVTESPLPPPSQPLGPIPSARTSPTPTGGRPTAVTPTPEPIAWVGPLLYPLYDVGQSPVPIFDLGSGVAHSIPTSAPIGYWLDWSPDGCFATYYSNEEIHVVNMSTLEDKVLFSVRNPPDVSETSPGMRLKWSPKGDWIAFSFEIDSPWSEIHLVRSDGTGLRQLTDNHVPDSVHGWSEEGQKVIYWRYHPEGSWIDGEGLWEVGMLDIDAGWEQKIARFRQPLESWQSLVITDVRSMQRIPVDIPGEPENVAFVKLFWDSGFRHYAILTAEDEFEGVCGGAKLYLLHAEEGHVQVINLTGFMIYGASTYADRSQLGFGAKGFDQGSTEKSAVYLLDMSTGEVGEYLAFDHWAPTWAPDGSMLSFTDEKGRAVLDVRTNRITRLPDVFGNRYWGLGWSPRMSYRPNACKGSGVDE